MRVSFWLRGFVLLLLVSVAGCDSSDPGTDPEPFRNPPDAIYVANQASATVSIIDPDSNAVAQTVDLVEKGFSENAKPHHVVVEPDGSAWYVSLINDDAVVKFDEKNQVLGTVDFPSPGMLSMDLTRDRLYAGHTMSIPDVPRTVAVIQRSDMSKIEELTVPFERPHGIKVRPNGQYAYSSSLSTNRISAIDTESNQVQTPFFFPEASRQRYVQMDISADGETAYVTGQVAGQVQILSLEDPAAPTFVDSVDVGAEPWHPQLSDDGELLYFGSKATNKVYVMDTGTYSTTTIEGEGLAQPHGSALSPDGRYLYISNNNSNGSYAPAAPQGTVVVIDTRTNEIQTVIEVGENPSGINSRWEPTEEG